MVYAEVVVLEAEHREWMRHLYQNFMKRYRGPIFTEHLYPAARSYTEDKFRWHMQQIHKQNPKAIAWLEKNLSKLWYRCEFSEMSKCDYLTNNVSESFNKQIKHMKALLPHELIDGIRELIMEKIALRREIAREITCVILPSVMKNLVNHGCSCRKWQVTGKPCTHALAWIRSNRGIKIKDFVHEYYSVEKFKATYAGRVPPMTNKSQWVVKDLGFKVWPSKQKRGLGRPRVIRIRGALEPGRRTVVCKRCKERCHFKKTCKLPELVENGDSTDQDSLAEDAPSTSKRGKKRKRDTVDSDDESNTLKKKKTPTKKIQKKKKKNSKKEERSS